MAVALAPRAWQVLRLEVRDFLALHLTNLQPQLDLLAWDSRLAGMASAVRSQAVRIRGWDFPAHDLSGLQPQLNVRVRNSRVAADSAPRAWRVWRCERRDFLGLYVLGR